MMMDSPTRIRQTAMTGMPKDHVEAPLGSSGRTPGGGIMAGHSGSGLGTLRHLTSMSCSSMVAKRRRDNQRDRDNGERGAAGPGE